MIQTTTQTGTSALARRATSGFTMTELMVSMVVLVIVTSQIMLAYTNQHNNAMAHERVIESQEEVRLVADVILADLRMAGFMVHPTAGVGSIDGGTTASDVLCVSDASAIDDSVLDDASSRFDGATITSSVGGNASTVTLSPLTLDIDGNGTSDFASAGGIIISSGTEIHCGVITAKAGNTIAFTPPTAAGFSASTSNALVVPALVYRVTGNDLTRNSTVLSSQIEDIQVEFGLDLDENGLVEGAEFPIDDLSGQDLDLIRLARIHVTARTPRAEPTFNGQFTGVANRTVAAADNFKRRRVSADALLRNLR